MSTLIKYCKAYFTCDKPNTEQFTTTTRGGDFFRPEIEHLIASVNSIDFKLEVYLPPQDKADIILNLLEVPNFISSTFDGRTSISLNLIIGREDDKYLFLSVSRIGLQTRSINNNVVELDIYDPSIVTAKYIGDIDKLKEVLSSNS
jgi:hypothetical protein